MREYQPYFEKNKYVYCKDFLDKQNCQDYVTEFKKLIDEGHGTTDTQCPLSISLGHTSLFDSLLEQLTSSIEKATGKSLYPTYAYARWYAPGDELKIHKDRPSCEISATINLGFEGGQWPIYVGHNKDKTDARQINMNVGDAVIYRGMDVYHWREKYVEGKWQAQVFVHYVETDGPNAEYKYDKRTRLAHHEEQKRFNGIYVLNENCFSKKSCEQIINSFENNKDKTIDAQLVGNKLDKSVRDTKKIEASFTKGIGATLSGIALATNYDQWNFNITHSNQCEYLHYDKDGHFNSHIDTLFIDVSHRALEMRKLTCILFLNDDYEGGRLYLQVGSERIYPNTSPGNVIVFPSFFLHGVEPIISGVRRSVVSWMVGPYFK